MPLPHDRKGTFAISVRVVASALPPGLLSLRLVVLMHGCIMDGFMYFKHIRN